MPPRKRKKLEEVTTEALIRKISVRMGKKTRALEAAEKARKKKGRND
jgi:hypothetical protein